MKTEMIHMSFKLEEADGTFYIKDADLDDPVEFIFRQEALELTSIH